MVAETQAPGASVSIVARRHDVNNLPDGSCALKRIIAAMAQDALTGEAEIARLKFQLARYRGPSAPAIVGLQPTG